MLSYTPVGKMSMNDHLCRIKSEQMSRAEMHRHPNTWYKENIEA